MSAFSKIKDKLFYGWIVVIAFSFAGTLLWGIRFSFGVFFKSIEIEFELSRAATSSIVSAQMILGGISTILAGWALDRYGPKIVLFVMGLIASLGLLLTSQTNSLWQVFLTYSVLLAMGTSSVYLVTISTVSRWFNKKRGLTLGIASVGSGLGTVILAPFATYLITNFDWRFAYLVIGLLALLVLPLSQLLKKEPREMGLLPDGVISEPNRKAIEQNMRNNDLSFSQTLKARSFWLCVPCFLLTGATHLLILTHIVPHAIDMGISAVEAAIVLSLTTGSSIAGRLILGPISDRIGKKPTIVICSVIIAVDIVWLIWAHSLLSLSVFAIIYGFAYGGRGPIMGGLVGEIFGLSKIGTILGVLECCWSTGGAIGPFIGGFIFDYTKSYTFAFLFAAVAILIVAILASLLKRETNTKPVNISGKQALARL